MHPALQAILAIIIVIALGGLFALGYFLNKKTKKPEGCEEMTERCGSCEVTLCHFNKAHQKEGEEHDNTSK